MAPSCHLLISIYYNNTYEDRAERTERTASIRVFHKRTKLAMLALLTNLYSAVFAVSVFLWNIWLLDVLLDISGYLRITVQG